LLPPSGFSGSDCSIMDQCQDGYGPLNQQCQICEVGKSSVAGGLCSFCDPGKYADTEGTPAKRDAIRA
jgi:hypothetical protein